MADKSKAGISPVGRVREIGVLLEAVCDKCQSSQVFTCNREPRVIATNLHAIGWRRGKDGKCWCPDCAGINVTGVNKHNLRLHRGERKQEK